MIGFNRTQFNSLRMKLLSRLLFALIALFFVACGGGTDEPVEPLFNTDAVADNNLPPTDEAENPKSTELPPTATPEPTATQAPLEEPTEVLETPESGMDRMIREAREKLLGAWVLSSFSGLDPNYQVPADELSTYRLVFNEDGAFYFSANCVTGSGSFTANEPNALSLDVQATLDENSSHLFIYKFLDALSHVDTKRFGEDDQTLDLRGMRGDLTFERVEMPVTAPVLVQSQVGIEPGQINLDTQGLFSSWAAHKVPGTDYSRDPLSGAKGLPEHIVITFDGTDPTTRQPTDAVMYIIPVAAYKELWEANGDACVTKTLNNLNRWLSGEGASHFTRGIVIMPFEEVSGLNGFTESGDSVWANGYSVIKDYAQDLVPVTNGESRYIYQGVTSDGQYFVAFFAPAAGEDFRFRTESQLGDLAWSLTIDGISGPNQNPIVDRLWQLQRIVYSDGTVIEVSDFEAYTIQINSDGLFNFAADCYTGNGELWGHNLESGAIRGTFVSRRTTVTPGDCEITPLSQFFIDALGEYTLSKYIMEEGMMILHNENTLIGSDYLLYFNDGGEEPQP